MMKTDRFEKALWTIILALSFFLAWAQIDMKREYDEIRLKRQMQYKAFLEQKDLQAWQLAYKTEDGK